ncbi:ribbon-helix-helix protein, CopG family [Roseococcus sp. SYP-B2431]|uniref:CopG family ribbon-helix-helix protein n=1 Tax=Roseococcus sp. SYP-B2431 TaxID=2496640 RepID=UPI00103DE016|nr:CopG family ribbon-helix-helix protein [Roseococcus sp. SYP-B2431]TCH98827.1 ribbon-helix-helix protein, CopG family [Roseococcus sp. SYP-B2431]
MPSSTTLTIRVTQEIKDQLDRLAASTHRSKSFLAAEAIAKYVEREAGIVLAIERGLVDADAGRLVPQDEAMARLEATIAAAERGKG